MDEETAKALGDQLRARRQALKLTTAAVAERAGITQPTYTRIEMGQFAEPKPDKLAGIAEALGLQTADLFAAVGYTVPTDLPSFKPYMRSKYSDLPEADIEAIEQYAAKLARKHGLALDGPSPGEDEA